MSDANALPPEQWFLTAAQRGNPSTGIDRRHALNAGWTEGNVVTPLIHGSDYFTRLYQEITRLAAHDSLWFCDWRGDANQLLAGPGTEVGAVFVAAVKRGVDVRGLIWRSHPDQTKFSEQENAHLGKVINAAGGKVLLDERVRRFGSHHQKIVVLRHANSPQLDVAFVGGIDLCNGRRDDARHGGDPRPVALDKRYGPTPAWHDIQMEVRGPAVGDLAETFRERWNDPTPLEHRNPLRKRFEKHEMEPVHPGKLPPLPAEPEGPGETLVQVVRTYPAKHPPYPFARDGERSVARAYQKAISNAERLIYVEDQYLWSPEIGRVFAKALQRAPELRLIAVVPRFPDRDGRFTGPLNRIGQQEALNIVHRAGGDRAGVYNLENESAVPIYVHAKVCIVDDAWVAIGSDNLNRRSWTNDSEGSCCMLGPGVAEHLRHALWKEHLGDAISSEELADPHAGFEAWRRTASTIDAWHARGKKGPRPQGRARVHRVEPVSPASALWAKPLNRIMVDPDGRPAALKRLRQM
ncbi:MAG: phospholipase D-like domain-containing protein [Actinomycetota bacterium]